MRSAIIKRITIFFFCVAMSSYSIAALYPSQLYSANKVARMLYSVYFNKEQEKRTKDIIKELCFILNDPTLKNVTCNLVKAALVPMLAHKIFSVYSINNYQCHRASNQGGNKCLKYIYFDGTTEIVAEQAPNKRKLILKAKPESPWHQLSFVDLIKRFRLINNLYNNGFPYPFLE